MHASKTKKALGHDLWIRFKCPGSPKDITWVRGRLAGHMFDMAIYPVEVDSQCGAEFADDDPRKYLPPFTIRDFGLDGTNILDLTITRLADNRVVYQWQSRLVIEAEDEETRSILEFVMRTPFPDMKRHDLHALKR